MKWLEKLQQQLSAVPAKYLVLDSPLEPGETVVGRLPEDLLRLLGLRHQQREELEERAKKHLITHLDGSGSRETCEAFHAAAALEKQQIDLLNEVFWAAIRLEFDLPKGDIAIRADGDVVTCSEDEGSSVLHALDEALSELFEVARR